MTLLFAFLLVIKGQFLQTADGINLWVDEHGKGTPIVVIHGGPGMDHMSLRADLAPLEKTHRVIYYDQRGGGRSSLPTAEGALSIEKHVDDLEALRKHFGFEKITLVAHSFGPAIAARYAIRYPDRVERMIFLAPVPPRAADFGDRYGAGLNARLTDAERKQADVLSEEMKSDSPQKVVEACRAYWKIMTPPRVARSLSPSLVKSDFCTASGEAIRFGMNVTNPATFSSLGDWNWTEELKKVEAPVLIIHGEEDAIPMDLVNEWVADLPNARIMHLEKTAHFPHAERPEIVFPAIETFLKGEFRAGAAK